MLYAGRLTKEKGIDLLADAFLAAHQRDPRLRLVLAGGSPEEPHLRDRLGDRATFLGWLDAERLARVYASADVFLFASRTDTFGQVILEAQASGLPVVAVDEGGPASLIAHGETGLLAPPDPDALASAVRSLVNTRLMRERVRRTALTAVSGRTWEASLQRLAAGYRTTRARTAVPRRLAQRCVDAPDGRAGRTGPANASVGVCDHLSVATRQSSSSVRARAAQATLTHPDRAAPARVLSRTRATQGAGAAADPSPPLTRPV